MIEEGRTGYLVKSYKVKYDRKTAREISRDFLANSQYPVVNRVVARVAPPETEPPTVPPTEAPTVPPETTPATEASIAETQPEVLSDPQTPDASESEQ